MSRNQYTHEELLLMLKEGNIPEKQIALLKFDYINDENDALALLNCLTGCDGKIREACAYIINKILSGNKSCINIFANLSSKKLADASIDINGNICRLAIDTSVMLSRDKTFSRQYINYILQYTNEALNELKKFIFRDKKYVINKQIFKLYWCLEAIKYFLNYIDSEQLKDILNQSVCQKEYTIREKVGEIVSQTNNFIDIKKLLINDENYYVRQSLNH